MEVEDETETEMEMDNKPIENSSTTATPSSSNRLGIKNTIHTNFGDDYVFQIASSQDNSALAVSLSSNAIKFYSSATGQYLGECRGHGGPIHEISFGVPSSPNVIASCSSDATVRIWDTRTFNQVSIFETGSLQEIYSFCFGGSSGNLLAAGCNDQILFWDWRNNKLVARLEESHMDDVTQVRFLPDQQNKLISASVDGLMCRFDTDGQIDDDNNLEAVMNVETSIAKFGFFGQTNQKLWCLTHIETLSVWDWKDTRREVNFEDARMLASDKWNLDNIDYFVDCYHSGSDDRLWVIGGTGSGTLGYFPVDYGPSGVIGSPEAILEGGHAGVVRTVLPVSGLSRGVFGWTGGEDGRLCCWLSGESFQPTSRSSVVKSPRNRGKNRHHPY